MVLGRCLMKQNKRAEAVAAFERAVAEARRCRVKLFELFALADCKAYECTQAGDSTAETMRRLNSAMDVPKPVPMLE